MSDTKPVADMSVADVDGPYREANLTFADGATRRVLYTDNEVLCPDGHLIVSRTDVAGVITHTNRSFVEMSGYTEADLIGRPHYILRHPEMPSAAFKDLWDTVRAGRKWSGYVKNLRKDGACYWVYASVIPNLRDGRVVGYTSVRRKPSRSKVEACIKLYSTLLEQ